MAVVEHRRVETLIWPSPLTFAPTYASHPWQEEGRVAQPSYVAGGVTSPLGTSEEQKAV